MATSTLDPDNIPEPDRQLGKGHGTSALGPGDTSDTGSDVQSGKRWTQEDDIGLDKGTNEDPDSASHDASAGPDIGDAGLDSDTDAEGTGERATAGRDTDIEMGGDIDTDHIERINSDEADEGDEAPNVERSDHPQGVRHPPRGAQQPPQRR